MPIGCRGIEEVILKLPNALYIFALLQRAVPTGLASLIAPAFPENQSYPVKETGL